MSCSFYATYQIRLRPPEGGPALCQGAGTQHPAEPCLVPLGKQTQRQIVPRLIPGKAAKSHPATPNTPSPPPPAGPPPGRGRSAGTLAGPAPPGPGVRAALTAPARPAAPKRRPRGPPPIPCRGAPEFRVPFSLEQLKAGVNPTAAFTRRRFGVGPAGISPNEAMRGAQGSPAALTRTRADTRRLIGSPTQVRGPAPATGPARGLGTEAKVESRSSPGGRSVRGLRLGARGCARRGEVTQEPFGGVGRGAARAIEHCPPGPPGKEGGRTAGGRRAAPPPGGQARVKPASRETREEPESAGRRRWEEQPRRPHSRSASGRGERTDRRTDGRARALPALPGARDPGVDGQPQPSAPRRAPSGPMAAPEARSPGGAG
ncbi:collagen alpha-1(I) chain-like [Cervus elaphus]|uniref:collagen alpha-1(I) chain-like n=1 Tax=Cervus elaphus TaxID=9860 RepID=UPI001CC2D61F|nr:collagen alpha-1(I) chain-like [Cervus elaphus]